MTPHAPDDAPAAPPAPLLVVPCTQVMVGIGTGPDGRAQVLLTSASAIVHAVLPLDAENARTLAAGLVDAARGAQQANGEGIVIAPAGELRKVGRQR